MRKCVPVLVLSAVGLAACVGPDGGSGRLPKEADVIKVITQAVDRKGFKKVVSVELKHLKCKKMEQTGIDSIREFQIKFGKDPANSLSFARCDVDAVVQTNSAWNGSPNPPMDLSRTDLQFVEQKERENVEWTAALIL